MMVVVESLPVLIPTRNLLKRHCFSLQLKLAECNRGLHISTHVQENIGDSPMVTGRKWKNWAAALLHLVLLVFYSPGTLTRENSVPISIDDN